MIDPRVASGLRDIPPAAMIPRERMLDSFRKTFQSFGFLPIETPHIERMEVLTGKGAGSVEVLRQIFDVTNKGGTPGELALRFDLTVPLARFVARHVNELQLPFKRYAIGSVFRGERPARGRFREFVQCDFDTVGTESALADAEIVQVIHLALSDATVPAFTITLNNRQILDGLLENLGISERSSSILRVLDKRDKIGKASLLELFKQLMVPGTPVENEPLLTPGQAEIVTDFAAQNGQADDVIRAATAHTGRNPRSEAGIASLRRILDLLDAAGVPSDRLKLDLGLARGLDYYTGVVFETTVNGWEKFGSISSGGRYDNLASLFTDRKLPGVGASIGLDRLLALLEEAGTLDANPSPAPVLVASFPGSDPAVAVRLASHLRNAGVGAEVFPDPIPIGKQMMYGTARGHKLAVIVGPDEMEREVLNLRDLATRQEQKGIPWGQIVERVQAALKGAGS